MCMPPIPRLQVPRESLPLEDPRYGLFSAATVVEDMDSFAQNGIQTSAVCDPGVNPYPFPECPTGMENPVKEGLRSESVVTADPFAIYAAEECPPLGVSNAEARARLRERILMGERHTVENIVYNGLVNARPLLRDPEAEILGAGAPTSIPQAVGMLEHRLSAMGRPGIIHAPRWMAAVMDSLRIVHRSGSRITTLLGTPVAFGSGYSGAGPYGQEEPAESSWLYATPQITVYRSTIYEPGTFQNGAFDPSTNRLFLLSERVYVVSWPCNVLAVATDAPLVAGLATLVSPPPTLTLIVSPTRGESPLDVSITVENFGRGDTTVDLGDGSAPVTIADGETYTHTYPDGGTYIVSATAPGSAGPVTRTVSVIGPAPEPVPDPSLTATPSSGQAPLEVAFTVDNHGNGPVSLTPGDGSPALTNPGDGTTATVYTYPGSGSYTATASSQATPSAQDTAQITVSDAPPPPDPAVSLDPTTGSAPLSVDITVDNHGNGPVSLTPGDGSPALTNPGDGTTVTTHVFASPGTYTVTASSQAEPTAQGTGQVAVSAPADPVPTGEPETGDAPLEVSFTVDNHGNGPVSLTPGDGSPALTNPGDGTTATAHTYADAGTYTVTATSQEYPDAQGTTTVTVSVPPPPAPTLTLTPDTGPIPLWVAFTVDNHGNGPVTVDPANGEDPYEDAGEGEPFDFQYTTAGEYTVTVTSNADPAAQATGTVTAAPQDPPSVELTPRGLAVDVLAQNNGNGPVSLDFGDDSPAGTNPGDHKSITEHTYAEAGTYTVTATSQADPTKTGSAQTTVTA